ncbi:hypothetical protein B5P46_11855 [Rhizobium leguminosarum]|uniref:Uncharacterized protein n=1 Tax=Rhizobium leguminosarum TaxID=384 RepID=A0A4Q1UBJ0_RHILE|nr:hypothetical protein [Rhizobium leguminosarum]RXT29369.1 hypothetical protein B5P46_11855 [Rhizobium leguminosarum]
MAVFKGPLKSSANAGQLSRDLAGKVGIKQYYNGALQMKGFEPIPQAGFDLLPGSAYVGAVAAATCRKGVLKTSATRSYVLIFTAGSVDIWRNDRVKVATVALPLVTLAMLPDLGFYGEADTFGIFHPLLPEGLRLLRNASNDAVWTLSEWPFSTIPNVDLGGSYTKTNDVWQLFVRWADGVTLMQMTCTVDGVTTAAVALSDPPDTASDGDWIAFAQGLEDAIGDLAGFSSGVDVAFNGTLGARYKQFTIAFGGALAGAEYQFSADVVNTSDASALVGHQQIGETVGEPLISASKGGFAGLDLYQDRAVYYAPNGKRAAIASSAVGEYFDLNIKSQADTGARLDALRSQTSETIRHVLDNTYLVVLTDQAEWFASNRTVSRNEPLNFVRASEIGSKANCRPIVLGGQVYFVSPDGGILYSIAYDAVSTTYVPNSENDLSKDLVSSMKRMAVQRKIGSTTSNRLWILRDDGRLVCIVINKTQEMNAACEWPVHGGGLVKELVVDGQEQVWITVDRGGVISEEILEESDLNLFQRSVTGVADLTGRVVGLNLLEGKTVWAEISGDIHGPYTVDTGGIDTDAPSTTVKVGLWAPPIYESMPYVKVLPDDSVVRRPGAVKAAKLYVMDTTSLAVGANGRPPKAISLNRTTDDLTLPAQGYTGHVDVLGLIGATMDPTLTISQPRPGRLRLRDYIPGVKL